MAYTTNAVSFYCEIKASTVILTRFSADAYTYLDLRAGNEYKIKASMYSSKELHGMKDPELLRKYPKNW